MSALVFVLVLVTLITSHALAYYAGRQDEADERDGYR